LACRGSAELEPLLAPALVLDVLPVLPLLVPPLAPLPVDADSPLDGGVVPRV